MRIRRVLQITKTNYKCNKISSSQTHLIYTLNCLPTNILLAALKHTITHTRSTINALSITSERTSNKNHVDRTYKQQINCQISNQTS